MGKLLTPLRRSFIQEFSKGLHDKAECMKRAGSKAKTSTARTTGANEILRIPECQEYLEELIEAQKKTVSQTHKKSRKGLPGFSVVNWCLRTSLPLPSHLIISCLLLISCLSLGANTSHASRTLVQAGVPSRLSLSPQPVRWEKIKMIALPDGQRRIYMNDSFMPLLKETSRWHILRGGAGSGKSHFESQHHILRLMGTSGHTFLLMRKVARTIKESIFRSFLGAIEETGTGYDWHINRSDMSFVYKPNGSRAISVGMDDQEKLKSVHGVTGALLEESTEFTLEDVVQINLRIRHPVDDYHQITLMFNPIGIAHWHKDYFYDNPPDSCYTHLSTYRDNRWALQTYIDQVEDLRTRKPSWYQVYGLGEWGKIEGVIYDLEIVESLPLGDFTIYGLDFGYNSPSALVEVRVKDFDPQLQVGDVYFHEWLYQKQLTPQQLGEAILALPIHLDFPIYADSAEPGTIETLRNMGLYVLPARKGSGSVESRTKFMQGLNLHTTCESVNLISEMQNLIWDVDKDGNKGERPIKSTLFADHIIDAASYALYTHCFEAPVKETIVTHGQMGLYARDWV